MPIRGRTVGTATISRTSNIAPAARNICAADSGGQKGEGGGGRGDVKGLVELVRRPQLRSRDNVSA